MLEQEQSKFGVSQSDTGTISQSAKTIPSQYHPSSKTKKQYMTQVTSHKYTGDTRDMKFSKQINFTVVGLTLGKGSNQISLASQYDT